ncbi:MAG TPA: hypothetical protein VLC29_00550 [Rhizomicrobium sp.]|nr:hypothetical protein [Rhizomicrobium sp.]
MTKPIDIRRFANLLSADSQLDGIERSLKRMGDRRVARKIADVRETLARALIDEQASLLEALVEPR